MRFGARTSVTVHAKPAIFVLVPFVWPIVTPPFSACTNAGAVAGRPAGGAAFQVARQLAIVGPGPSGRAMVALPPTAVSRPPRHVPCDEATQPRVVRVAFQARSASGRHVALAVSTCFAGSWKWITQPGCPVGMISTLPTVAPASCARTGAFAARSKACAQSCSLGSAGRAAWVAWATGRSRRPPRARRGRRGERQACC